MAVASAAAAAAAASPEGGLHAAVKRLRRHGATDDPRRAAEERAAGEVLAGRGSPRGQPREAGHLREAHVEAAPSSGGQLRRWRLTAEEGVPCYLPFLFEGATYEDCHPEGWCCLDPLCSRRGACEGGGAAGHWQPLPLVHPRDRPGSECRLPAVGARDFLWRPSVAAGAGADDTTVVFLLLDAERRPPWEEDFVPLLELAREPVSFVWLSYSSDERAVRRLMLHLQSRLEEVLRNATVGPRQEAGPLRSAVRLPPDAAAGRFFFVRTPAWHVSVRSCWLPSVIQAWSRMDAMLTVWPKPNSSGEAALLRTVARGVRGGWAAAWGEDGGAPARPGPLRWLGPACGGREGGPSDGGGWPAPAPDVHGAVALVRRGGCSFYRKVKNAWDAGAAAVVVFSLDEAPIAMGCAAPDPCTEALPIPAAMVGRSHGRTLLRALGDGGLELKARLAGERRGPSLALLRGGGGGLRAAGRLGGSGGFLRDVAREAMGLDRERRLAARRAELEAGGGPARLVVFDRQRLAGSLTAAWPAANAAALREQGVDSLELELWLDCDDHLDKNCGPWDFEINLFLCGEGQPSCRAPEASVGRWITPYGREARWVSNATAALPLLLRGPGVLHLQSNWWQAYTVTLALWPRRAPPAAARGPPLARLPLWRGGRFAEDYNAARGPRHFHVPEAAARAVLSVLLTGHGWGVEEANCAEFCNHSHHFLVNGRAEHTRAFPSAGSDDGCGALVARGVVPNQYGTWTFGRAGWCPGMPVEWWEADVTSQLLAGGLQNNITYRALFNGTDYAPLPARHADDNGYAAEIHLASFLTFYGRPSPGHGDGGAAGGAASAGRRPLLLL